VLNIPLTLIILFIQVSIMRSSIHSFTLTMLLSMLIPVMSLTIQGNTPGLMREYQSTQLPRTNKLDAVLPNSNATFDELDIKSESVINVKQEDDITEATITVSEKCDQPVQDKQQVFEEDEDDLEQFSLNFSYLYNYFNGLNNNSEGKVNGTRERQSSLLKTYIATHENKTLMATTANNDESPKDIANVYEYYKEKFETYKGYANNYISMTEDTNVTSIQSKSSILNQSSLEPKQTILYDAAGDNGLLSITVTLAVLFVMGVVIMFCNIIVLFV